MEWGSTGRREPLAMGWVKFGVVNVQGQVSVLVKCPVVSSETTAVGDQPSPGRSGRFWLGYGSCHKNRARLRGQSQRVASAELLPPFVLIAGIYN